MNAQLAAKTTGIVNCTGNIPKPIATAPTTGKKVLAVATFDVISVKNIIIVATHNISTIGGTVSRTVNACPIQSPNPDDPICAANDNPPPNNINNPQGNLFACSHVSRSLFESEEGIIKNISAANNATPASVNNASPGISSRTVLNHN